MGADTVRAFFDELPTRTDPSKTAGMNNSYVFDIEGVGQWTVRVDDGQVSVAEGAEDADTTISGMRSEAAPSAARAIFSPTTDPMEPPMNPKSMTVTATGRPPIRPLPQIAASRMPVLTWAAASRSI